MPLKNIEESSELVQEEVTQYLRNKPFLRLGLRVGILSVIFGILVALTTELAYYLPSIEYKLAESLQALYLFVFGMFVSVVLFVVHLVFSQDHNKKHSDKHKTNSISE